MSFSRTSNSPSRLLLAMLPQGNRLSSDMPRIFGRLFGTRSRLAQARAAELRGDLAHAAVLSAGPEGRDEPAGVVAPGGDAGPAPPPPPPHSVQAAAPAPPASAVHTHALRKRASAILAMAADAPMTGALRKDLAQ